jgi:hypothetical protein
VALGTAEPWAGTPNACADTEINAKLTAAAIGLAIGLMDNFMTTALPGHEVKFKYV